MSKIICDVCGTSYPDTATQCPICGCVSTSVAQGTAAAGEAGAAGYTYVKGGRFSKANVRKRNIASGGVASSVEENGKTSERKTSGKDNKGLTIAAIVLFLAIIAVVLYITIRLVSGANDPGIDPGESDSVQQEQEETISCERIYFDLESVVLTKEGAIAKLFVTVEPGDTTDVLGQAVSENPEVATAVLEGKAITITAVGEAEPVIDLTCGTATATCPVKCSFEKKLELPQQIKLTKEGQTMDIYPDDILRTEIEWESDDTDIATVKDGTVTAVAEGTTLVRAKYNDQVVECEVICEFTEEETDAGNGDSGNDVINGTGGVTEDGGSTGGNYRLNNILGANDEDISLSVNDSAPFELLDGNGNRVSGVTWSSSDTNCCTVADGVITAKSSGSATITATYGGQTYSCRVIVW